MCGDTEAYAGQFAVLNLVGQRIVGIANNPGCANIVRDLSLFAPVIDLGADVTNAAPGSEWSSTGPFP